MTVGTEHVAASEAENWELKPQNCSSFSGHLNPAPIHVDLCLQFGCDVELNSTYLCLYCWRLLQQVSVLQGCSLLAKLARDS